MNLEIHIIQSFAPSNLNRDDTGSPKDCEFGGVRRARISSQCWKRSMRLAFEQQGVLKEESLAVRTRRIASSVADYLSANGKEADAARAVADNALNAIGLGAGKSGDSEYLLFVPKVAVDQFAKACLDHWDVLHPRKKAGKEEEPSGNDKAADLAAKKALDVLFRCGKAADLALFGRMIADKPEHNIVAATQVAHALSTHRVDIEFDFYTAVDDLQPKGKSGAGMMGTVEYNAACFYRYANIDLGQLRKNLDGNATLASEAVEAVLRAAIEAIPTGKQNSMAARNPPSLVLVVLRESGFWSLANAFLKPVRANSNGDLAEASISALGSYWEKLTQMYGEPDGAWLGVSTLHPEALNGMAGKANVQSVPSLVQAVAERCSRAFGA